MVNKVYKILRSRFFQEILFWAISFLILLNLFTRTYQSRLIDYIYTGLFHLPLVSAVLVNSLVLIPRVLSNGRYLVYLLLLVPLYGITYLLYGFSFSYLADWIFPGYYFVATYTPLEILGVFIFYIGITSLIEFSKSWFREMEMEKKMESLQKEKVETELKALKAQINPHFLFNSLNHIYSLANRKAPDTAPAILQLSDLLRYTLQQMENEKVPLGNEINYLEKYVDLYKKRVQFSDQIHFEIDGEVENLSIAPLLLIAFVENCFKHGTLGSPDEKIDIKIKIKGDRLQLFTFNHTDARQTLPEESGGIGLDNVRRRLNLLYPEKHTLTTENLGESFTARLELDLV